MNEASDKLKTVTVSTASGGSAEFPIMEGGGRRAEGDLKSIPWAMIAPHDAAAQRNHGGQNLIRLAQRGGLCPLEAVAVLEDVHYRTRWPDTHDRETCEKQTLEARAILKQMVSNWPPPNVPMSESARTTPK